MSTSGPSLERMKESMRATWMAGDFGVVAKMLAVDAERFAGRLGIVPGVRALDVACGTGNVAIPMTRLGAVVTGVDIAPNLLEQARARVAEEGLAATFEEGDAEQLPYADGTFDIAVSMFGAMFAPRPALVASELARVLKPGGLLAMANWTPAGFSGEMFRVSARHVPPAAGVAPPVLWGEEATVRERLEPFFEEIRTELVPVDFHIPTNAAGVVTFFRTYFGPTKVAFSRLDEAGQAALAGELEALWTAANVAADGATHTHIRNEYMEVTARRR